MKRTLLQFLSIPTLAISLLSLVGCGGSGDSATTTIGVSFETLQTEFWVAALESFEKQTEAQGLEMLQSVADGDANRQLDQIRNFITRGVDGIVVVPKDARTIIPAIRLANQAGIPIVCFNRPPAESDAKTISVVADNYAIAKATVEKLIEQARSKAGKRKGMILIGDLGDINAIARRDGFFDAVKQYPDFVEVVSQIPTEWNQEKAQAGVVNALQANPDIDFIFSSSDFLLPSIVSALKAQGKYHPSGTEGHIFVGSFDGDATAYQMLVDGYLDADGVQDVDFEVSASINAILDHIKGKDVPAKIVDPGFIAYPENLEAMAARMWGANQ